LPYTFTPYQLPGLLVVEGKSHPDDRGYFMESFRECDMAGSPIPRLVQDNLSRSKKGVLRGMHYQKTAKPVGKLVRCVRGRIFDVAVDIRKGSPTYGKWASIELGDEGNRMLWVPPGFAHGFYTLSDVADVMYKVTDYWAPEVDRGIRWSCPEVAIAWPKGPVHVAPKDEAQPILSQADNDFVWP
jgi:dTDP-4-dehydrorhamnose 3,5-epimerase